MASERAKDGTEVVQPAKAGETPSQAVGLTVQKGVNEKLGVS